MDAKRNILTISTAIFLILLTAVESKAQKFEVSGFRLLPNDVSAFIQPVTDLNGEDCALLKVQAGEDFAFSTPLGIVRREDKTGEIWLYIPARSKKITIKHPEWGVMRDYMFPSKINSHMTYEMKIQEPETGKTQEVMTVVNTVRDTLVVTRVDTVMMQKPKTRIPFSISALASIGFGGKTNTMLGGLMLTAMRRHGGWIHVQTDFNKTGTTQAVCGRYGDIDGYTPYYTGKKRHGCLLMSAGAIHRISSVVNIFEGLGYGYNSIAWERSDKEGGGYVKNSYYSNSGLMFEVGAIVNIKRVTFSASVNSISGKQWFGAIGVGYRIK